MSRLYLLHYNNYYNRIVKYENSLAAYLQYAVRGVIDKANFNFNDGVITEHIANIPAVMPDYMLVCDDQDNIKSRWFVIDPEKQSGNQYNLVLRRDLWVDFYDVVMDAPAFIEKGHLQFNNPLIFNKEQMTFNQVKKEEHLIKDETKIPWLVGYVPRDAYPSTVTVEAPLFDTSNVYENVDLPNWEFYDLTQGETFDLYDPEDPTWMIINLDFRYGSTGKYFKGRQMYCTRDTVLPFELRPGTVTTPSAYYIDVLPYTRPDLFKGATTEQLTLLYIYLTAQIAGVYHSNFPISTLLAYNGKVIRDTSSNTLYKVVVEQHRKVINDFNLVGGNAFTYWQNNILPASIAPNVLQGNADATSVIAEFSVITYSVRLEVFHEQVYVELGPNRNHLMDAPYDMFCIPFDDEKEISDSNNTYTSNKLAALAIATAIGASLGSGNIYDIQLLPYCPVRDYVKEDGSIDVGAAPVSIVKDERDVPLFPIMWATTHRFSFEIEPTDEMFLRIPSDPVEYKVDNETRVYRLSDPAQSAFFEFNVAKNGGSVTKWDIDCNYKPFTPYIHVSPKFWGLYGQDFNDVRGLICGGDFSLSQITSAWAEYQLQNKNYQLMFDREIKSLDIQQDIARQKDVLNAAIGIVGGGVAGSVKGPVGAITGAAAGGLKGISSLVWNEQLRQETKSYKQDMFGYELGNIKAIPYAISKISAFTQNNKIFPFLEIYEATDTEVEAFKNKLKYNGMTVMVIGKISDYINPNARTYVKGRFIRLEGLDAEYHEASELAEEFEKGVYIGEEDGNTN